MPRRPRSEVEPGVHHAFSRGNNRQSIFLDDRDRSAYLGMLAQAVRRYAWRCLAYCLMPNHVHLLVETTTPNLGSGVRWLHGSYARRFNDRHRRCGHLFQGRFGSVRIEDDAQLWMTARYIARNPVEAGLCRGCEDWRWSSHGVVTDERSEPWMDVARLLELVGAAGGDPRRRYAELVA